MKVKYLVEATSEGTPTSSSSSSSSSNSSAPFVMMADRNGNDAHHHHHDGHHHHHDGHDKDDMNSISIDNDTGTTSGVPVPSMASLLTRLAMLHRLQDEMMNHRKIGMHRLRNKIGASQQENELKQYYIKQQQSILALQLKLNEQEQLEQQRAIRLRRLQQEQERIEQDQVRLLEQQLKLIVEEEQDQQDSDHDEQKPLFMEKEEGQDRNDVLHHDGHHITDGVGPKELPPVKLPVLAKKNKLRVSTNNNNNSSNNSGNGQDESGSKYHRDSMTSTHSSSNSTSSTTGGGSSSHSDLPLVKLRVSNTKPRVSPPNIKHQSGTGETGNHSIGGNTTGNTTGGGSSGNSTGAGSGVPNELPVVKLSINNNKNKQPASNNNNNKNIVLPNNQRESTSSGSSQKELPIVKLRINNNNKLRTSNNDSKINDKHDRDSNSMGGSQTELPVVKLPNLRGSNKKKNTNHYDGTTETTPKNHGGQSGNSNTSNNGAGQTNSSLVTLPSSDKPRVASNHNTNNNGTDAMADTSTAGSRNSGGNGRQHDLPRVKLPGTFLRVRVVDTPNNNNKSPITYKKDIGQDQDSSKRSGDGTSGGGGMNQPLPIVKLPKKSRAIPAPKKDDNPANNKQGGVDDEDDKKTSETNHDKLPPERNPYLVFVKPPPPNMDKLPHRTSKNNNDDDDDDDDDYYENDVHSDSSGDSSARGSQHDLPVERLRMSSNSYTASTSDKNKNHTYGGDESGSEEENSSNHSLPDLPILKLPMGNHQNHHHQGVSSPIATKATAATATSLPLSGLYTKTRSTTSIIERNTSILRNVFEVSVTDNDHPFVPDSEDVTVASFTHAFMHHGGDDNYQDDFTSDEEEDDHHHHPNGEPIESSTLCDILEHETHMTDPYGDGGQYTGSVLRSTGMPHGFGRMVYSSDSRTYEGHWRDGRWHGTGMATFPNGDSYQGEYRSDFRHGEGRYCWSDGRVYEGAFRDDKRHGHGTFFFPDGSKYEGNFYKGLRQGHGTHKFANGGYYTGSWVNGRYEGRGEFRWADGSTYKGEWKAGMAHGMGIETYPDGRVRYQGRWIEDEPVSKGYDSSRNGQSSSTAVVKLSRKVSAAPSDKRDDLWA